MCLLSFKKITTKQNILFDEFFVQYTDIAILSFNYNAQGAALCVCDGELTSIDAHRLEKILFGVQTHSLTNYLKSIFAPNFQSDEIHRTGGELIFRSQELTQMKKYDIANLAKKTLKEVTDEEIETFTYFTEEKGAACQSRTSTPAIVKGELFGNTNSKILHKSSCINFNPKVCTVSFSNTNDAVAAGYKACGKCKP